MPSLVGSEMCIRDRCMARASLRTGSSCVSLYASIPFDRFCHGRLLRNLLSLRKPLCTSLLVRGPYILPVLSPSLYPFLVAYQALGMLVLTLMLLLKKTVVRSLLYNTLTSSSFGSLKTFLLMTYPKNSCDSRAPLGLSRPRGGSIPAPYSSPMSPRRKNGRR